MALVKWDPFRDVNDFFERFNRFWNLPAQISKESREGLATTDWVPAVDISETDAEYQIKAELPEVKKKDVKVSIEERVLTIQGERKHEKEEKKKKYHRVERCFGSFTRSFSLPGNIAEDKITADFKNGVLLLHVPKTEKAKPEVKEIPVT